MSASVWTDFSSLPPCASGLQALVCGMYLGYARAFLGSLPNSCLQPLSLLLADRIFIHSYFCASKGARAIQLSLFLLWDTPPSHACALIFQTQVGSHFRWAHWEIYLSNKSSSKSGMGTFWQSLTHFNSISPCKLLMWLPFDRTVFNALLPGHMGRPSATTHVPVKGQVHKQTACSSAQQMYLFEKSSVLSYKHNRNQLVELELAIESGSSKGKKVHSLLNAMSNSLHLLGSLILHRMLLLLSNSSGYDLHQSPPPISPRHLFIVQISRLSDVI